MADNDITPNGAHDVVLTGEYTYNSIQDKIASLVFNQKKHPLAWFFLFALGFTLLNVLMVAIYWLLYKGVGIWGINQPAGWGFAIINFVWWIGIGHAGTLISAILLLLRQQWRGSINRFAEAMTLFAVMCAGLFPLLHTGRPWVAYWLFPYPNVLGMWPQFRSPLVWDVFAVSTYITVSALFWYVGLIPDFATLRDRTRNRMLQILFGMLSFGWRGSYRHWFRYETAYLILAGLSTPLVLSVHSIVSFDFAVSMIPGWHMTLFPPYFVAGAVYAGFAMVLTLALPVRAWYKLKDLITMHHIDMMCKVMLATGLIVAYAYIVENFYGWYSGDRFEWFMNLNRLHGPYRPYYYLLLFCNVIAPQILWWPAARRNIPTVFIVAQIVGVGMWLERFIIIPVSLHRDFLPSSWGFYVPTIWDVAMYLGTIGLFLTMMFLFIRFVPIINIFEMKDLLDYRRRQREPEHGHAEPVGTAS